MEQPAPGVPVAPRPIRRGLLATVLAGALLAAVLLAGASWLQWQRSWVRQAEPGDPLFGLNYSCNQAEYLLLEEPGQPSVPDDRPGRSAWCAETLDRILAGTGARYVRLSIEWNEVEPRPGEYRFELLDALLATARENGAKVLLSIGMKGQRHPEYYLPDWVLAGGGEDGRSLGAGAEVSRDPLARPAALALARAVVRHVGSDPVVDSWMVENEPFHASPRASDWTLGRDYTRELSTAIREADPLDRPNVINHAERWTFDRRWKWTLEDADIVATSIYPWRRWKLGGHTLGVVSILEFAWLTPNYAGRARETHDAGKQFWLTEMQAEPWADPDLRLFTPAHPADDLTPPRLRKNIEYARRTGADRVYLWGAEWWLFQRERHREPAFWDIAAEALGQGGR